VPKSPIDPASSLKLNSKDLIRIMSNPVMIHHIMEYQPWISGEPPLILNSNRGLIINAWIDGR
jgi:hypothetical protein